MADGHTASYRPLTELLSFVTAGLPTPLRKNGALGRWLERSSNLPEVTNFGFEYHLAHERVDLLLAVAHRPEQVSNVCAWLDDQSPWAQSPWDQSQSDPSQSDPSRWPTAKQLACWLENWGNTHSAIGQLWLEFDDSDITTPAIFFSNLTDSSAFIDEALNALTQLGLLNTSTRTVLDSWIDMDGIRVTDIAAMANRHESPIRLNFVYDEQLFRSQSITVEHGKLIEALKSALPEVSLNVAINIFEDNWRLSGFEVRPKTLVPNASRDEPWSKFIECLPGLTPSMRKSLEKLRGWAIQSSSPADTAYPSSLILEGLKHYRHGPLLQRRVLSHMKYGGHSVPALLTPSPDAPDIKAYLGVHSVPASSAPSAFIGNSPSDFSDS